MPPDKYRRILEVGAGAGDETKALIDAGYEVTGITFGVDNINNAKEKYGITLYEIDMHDLPKSWRNRFDGAVIIHTLEHSIAPIIVIGELYFTLRNHGRVYVVTPDPDNEKHRTIWHTALMYPNQVKYYFEYWGFKCLKCLSWSRQYEFVFEKLPPSHPEFRNWNYLQWVYMLLEKL